MMDADESTRSAEVEEVFNIDLEKGPDAVAAVQTDESYPDQTSDQQDAGDAAAGIDEIEISNRKRLTEVIQKLDSLNEPVTYSWDRISCFVPLKHGHKCNGASCRKHFKVQPAGQGTQEDHKKQILYDVTGVAKSGQLFAIMGSSGSGKTTLLNVLNMRSHLERNGQLKLNGVPVTRNMIQEVAAYVQQDDLFLPHLTVEEHLTFAAMLRVPSFVTYRERKLLIEKIMDDVGLLKVRKTQIGSARKFRGISGGEMKRLNFATEVLTNPSILFCDEPTSGLDGFTTASIVGIMKKLADEGKTIISTIHQPSSNVLAMFDRVYLLAEGRVAFSGTVSEALDFMKMQGFECPATYNPADFLVHTLAINPDGRDACLEKVTKICDNYAMSEQATLIRLEAANTSRHSKAVLKLVAAKRPKYWANWFQQLFWLMWRQQFVIRREPLALSTQIIQAVGVAVFVGSVFSQPGFEDINVRNIVSLGFVVVSQAVLFPQYAVITTFSEEMPVFMRENEQRVYRIDCYYLAKFFSETPLYSIMPTVTAMIVYPWTEVAKFGSRSLFLITTTMGFAGNIGRSLGYLISIIGGDAPTALQLGPVFVVPFFLFNGLMVSSETLLEGLHWLEAVSWIYLCTESTTIAIWQDQGSVKPSPQFPTHYGNGSGVLDAYGFNKDNLTKNFTVLLFEIIIANILSFLILIARAVYNQRK